MFLLTPLLPREIVLDRLATLVKSFVRAVSLARGLSEAAAESAGGKIFPFGSYRLGVYGPGADIDALCVVPKHVSRDDFFDAFEGMLRDTDGVTEVVVRYPSFPARVVTELAFTGRSRCPRSHHQAENLGDPNRFSHGPS
jgi:poly(A) polymerase